MVPVPIYDFPAIRAQTPDEMLYFKNLLISMKLATNSGDELRLTSDGWTRVNELRGPRRRKLKQAFVAMWFDLETEAAFTDGIEPGVKLAGYDPLRIDRKPHNNSIDDEMIAEIRRSGLMVADFTGHRQSVYYEAGFAVGLGIPVIRTCREDQMKDARFDVRQYNHLTWTTPENLREALANHIKATAPAPDTP